MKIKYFVAGMISLIVFGLLLPQPIQALFVYTSLKSFFDSHLVLLCILVHSCGCCARRIRRVWLLYYYEKNI